MNYRLDQVVIEGFRGYGRRQEIYCGGDAVLLIGPNGWGKTSFFDAISWCLFGRIKRLLGSRDAIGEELIRNRFMPEIEPTVSLTLTNSDGVVVVARDASGLQVVVDEGELVGAEASDWVSRLVGGPWRQEDGIS